ncbi:unnamed protein product [Dibothriocephalus latus]|uniref:Ubiquitin-like domain-containing protein n=1 Tax=Dibothriocephalus latus TaxID=60516 RepID=A0A3P7LWN0_DIBLA|nr:unnamed protein product [Dibothriocephalus latus]
MLLKFRFEDKTVDLDADENWNMLFLKQRVSMELEIDSQVHFLAFKGTQLDEWDKVSTHNFQDGDILEVYTRGTFRHFYVLCYICNTVVPAVITIHCDTCKSSDFSALPTSSLLNHCKVSGGHILCLDCFRSYAESYLDNRNFKLIPQLGYTLGCPVGCPDVYISDTHHFRILGSQFYSRYKEIAAHQVCYTDNFCNCPRCDTCWEIPSEPGSLHWVFCEGPFGCGVEFCTRCRNFVRPRTVNTDDNPKFSCFCDAPEMEAEAGETQSTGTDNVTWKGVILGPLEIASRCLIASTCKRCPARCDVWVERIAELLAALKTYIQGIPSHWRRKAHSDRACLISNLSVIVDLYALKYGSANQDLIGTMRESNVVTKTFDVAQSDVADSGDNGVPEIRDDYGFLEELRSSEKSHFLKVPSTFLLLFQPF